MAFFSPSPRKRTRSPSPPDCLMDESYSHVATDGASECMYAFESIPEPSTMQSKTCASALTAANLQKSAAVSPFLDFRSNTNTLMLSQSSTASSLTFDTSVRMDLEETPQNITGHRSGTIFDSGVCFISSTNNDNHSSVSMESPMRNCSMSLEPVRKKARTSGGAVFGGLSVAIPGGGMAMDSVAPPNDSKEGKQSCCHVCGNNTSESVATPKSAKATDSAGGQSQKAKTTKCHSLFNYFSKSKGVSTKKLSASKPASIVRTQSAPSSNHITCNYCDKPTCSPCTRQCERCSRDFCTFCSKVDYRGVVEKILCFECVNEVDLERNGGDDADMMDL